MTEAEIRKGQREEDSFSAVNVLVWAYEAGEINYSQYRLLVKATVRAIEYGELPQNERV